MDLDLSRDPDQSAASCSRSLLARLPFHYDRRKSFDPWILDRPRTQLVCQDVFFLFTLTSKTQLRAFLRSSLRAFYGRFACSVRCNCLRWPGVFRSRSWAFHWVGLVAPSQCRPVWTGSALAPGGARPDFSLMVNIH